MQPSRATFVRRRVVALSAVCALLAGLWLLVRDPANEGATRRLASGGPAGAPADHGGSSAAARSGRVEAAGPNLRPGSDPSVLPGPVLIADRDNNRLLEVSPGGKVIWRFPPAGGVAGGLSFKLPDDAFFTPGGTQIVATQEDDFAISVVDMAGGRIAYRYGHPGESGSAPGYLFNPDDAMMTRSGEIITADIKNCRLLVLRPPSHAPVRQLGQTGTCEHVPGVSYASPNGAFPMASGDTAVTEIGGDWLDVISPHGRALSAINPPGFSYPSDTNEVRPGLFLSADYTEPGAIETFTSTGRLRWRYEPTGAEALNQPSLALPLPNGDVLANDDKNQRVIVVDPRSDRVVWQYGHTHVSGSADGYLSNPDGVDLAPPYSLADRFPSMTAP